MVCMILVLDAAALLNNDSFEFRHGDEYFTTPEVFSEWRSFSSRALSQNALKSGALKIKSPSEESLGLAKDKCAETGTILGKADVSIIALALDLRASGIDFIVLTDDYSVQNVLKFLGIKFDSVIQGTIRKQRFFRSRKKNSRI